MENEGYVYFISYKHQDGYANAEVEMTTPINTIGQLQEIEQKLPEILGGQDIQIIDYRYLRRTNETGNGATHSPSHVRYFYLVKYIMINTDNRTYQKDEIYSEEKINSLDFVRGIETFLQQEQSNKESEFVLLAFDLLREEPNH